MSDDDKYVDTTEELEELQADSLFLECLQQAGVDNWDGYDYAVELFKERTGND